MDSPWLENRGSSPLGRLDKLLFALLARAFPILNLAKREAVFGFTLAIVVSSQTIKQKKPSFMPSEPLSKSFLLSSFH
jgi:hypothetical protein